MRDGASSAPTRSWPTSCGAWRPIPSWPSRSPSCWTGTSSWSRSPWRGPPRQRASAVSPASSSASATCSAAQPACAAAPSPTSPACNPRRVVSHVTPMVRPAALSGSQESAWLYPGTEQAGGPYASVHRGRRALTSGTGGSRRATGAIRPGAGLPGPTRHPARPDLTTCSCSSPTTHPPACSTAPLPRPGPSPPNAPATPGSSAPPSERRGGGGGPARHPRAGPAPPAGGRRGAPAGRSVVGGVGAGGFAVAVEAFAELGHLAFDASELLAEVVAGGHLTERQADRGELPRQVLGVGERPGVGPPVGEHLLTVALLLPVLGQQDQWRRVRRLQRQGQGEQDERVGVEVQARHPGGHVPHDPKEHHHRLEHEVARGPKEAGDRFGEVPERLRVVVQRQPRRPPPRRGQARPAPYPARDHAHPTRSIGSPPACPSPAPPSGPPFPPPPLRIPPQLPYPPSPSRARTGPRRQAGGSRWSSTSSMDTAPSNRDCSSQTGAHSRS